MRELAKRAGVTRGYVTRIVRLACFAPDLVEGILDGRRPPTLTVERLREPIPLDWKERRRRWQRNRWFARDYLAVCEGSGECVSAYGARVP
jgi:hypothetical protein